MRQSQSLKVSSSPSRVSGTAIVIFLLCLCSCVPKNKTSSRLKVIASVPVVYDWTRNLMDEESESRLFLNLIVKNGSYHNTLNPGVTEENLIDSAALLIYVGGPSEKWIDEYVEKTVGLHPERLVLRLYDFASSQSDVAVDEHFILAPDQAMICCNKICEYLCILDSQNEDSYRKMNSKYNELLSILDSTYKLQSTKTVDKTFIICDRMPFKFLFNEYKFNYVSLYDCCPAPQKSQPPAQTLQQFGNYIDDLKASEVYVFDKSDKKLAKQVIANSKNPKCDTLEFNSMETLTLSELFSGKNYIDIMQNNLTLLRPN